MDLRVYKYWDNGLSGNGLSNEDARRNYGQTWIFAENYLKFMNNIHLPEASVTLRFDLFSWGSREFWQAMRRSFVYISIKSLCSLSSEAEASVTLSVDFVTLKSIGLWRTVMRTRVSRKIHIAYIIHAWNKHITCRDRERKSEKEKPWWPLTWWCENWLGSKEE